MHHEQPLLLGLSLDDMHAVVSLKSLLLLLQTGSAVGVFGVPQFLAKGTVPERALATTARGCSRAAQTLLRIELVWQHCLGVQCPCPCQTEVLSQPRFSVLPPASVQAGALMAACAHDLYAPAASTDPKVATLGASCAVIVWTPVLCALCCTVGAPLLFARGSTPSL